MLKFEKKNSIAKRLRNFSHVRTVLGGWTEDVHFCCKLTLKAMNRFDSLHHWYQLCRFLNQAWFNVNVELRNCCTDDTVTVLPADNYREIWTNAELYILDKPSELKFVHITSITLSGCNKQGHERDKPEKLCSSSQSWMTHARLRKTDCISSGKQDESLIYI